jgi:hypothetical protein
VLELRFGAGLSAGDVQRALGVASDRAYRRLLTEAMSRIDAKLDEEKQGGRPH